MEEFKKLTSEIIEAGVMYRQLNTKLEALLKTEILPRFCNAMGYDERREYFIVTEQKVRDYDDSKPMEISGVGDYKYVTCIDIIDGSIQDGKYDHQEQKFYKPDHWQGVPIKETSFSWNGQIEFIEKLTRLMKHELINCIAINEKIKKIVE
jgi:hypothetical protein